MNKTVRERLEEHIANRGSFRTAIAVQGGGMRGVYSMGALAHLEKSGLRNAFDLVVGASAGAINGAYLLAGQAHQAVKVYIDYLSGCSFINPLRVYRIVDIDYMVDIALKQFNPLDIKALQESSSLLQVVLTDSETGEARIVSNRDEDVDFYEAIRATAAMPALYNKKVLVGGHLCIDGGIAEPIPVCRAIDWGANFTVAVASHVKGYRHPPMSKIHKVSQRLALCSSTDIIKNMMETIDARYSETMELLEDTPSINNLYGVWPSDEKSLAGRTTRDKKLLKKCALLGESDMQKMLDSPFYESNIAEH
ncbi:MAG: patatin-like phospholipase family protein [Coriobacteriia bacterium]|nr:patatin-like phospholipase family protein [Coriobacteriia bacterium]